MESKRFSFAKVEDTVTIVLLVVCGVSLAVQVIGRMLFKISPIWCEELARYTYIWFVYFGASITTRMKAHLKIDAVLSLYPRKIRPYIVEISEYIWLAFNVIIVVVGFQFTINIFNIGTASTAMKIPMWIIDLACPVGYLFITIRLIVIKIQKYRNWKTVCAEIRGATLADQAVSEEDKALVEESIHEGGSDQIIESGKEADQ